ncbi:hypothetical protein [Campylobacter rectus]|uniref:hypothetical protein n=1 Tax=Campylobacter rectus TaxID=203 RepID=UPI000587DD2B|nr:hypothetical protein [Campylobacter rectus]UEB46822.1 hypothetical protein LK437_07300 [Campylobacter rectus]
MGKVASEREIESFFCIKFAGSLDGSLCDVNSAYFAGSALSFPCGGLGNLRGKFTNQASLV